MKRTLISTTLLFCSTIIYCQVLLKDINQNNESSFPQNFVSYNDSLYYMAKNGYHWNLWKTDGTKEGTVVVEKEVNYQNFPNICFPQNSFCNQVYGKGKLIQEGFRIKIGENLFFSGTGSELIKYNLNTCEETILKDLKTEPNFSILQNLITMNGTLLFTNRASDGSEQLWKSDGTDNGTQIIKDSINIIGDDPRIKLANNNILYFFSNNQLRQAELWKSDGTTAGTTMVKSILKEGNDSYPTSIFISNETLYFGLVTPNGTSLWKSDGTSKGTTKIKDLYLQKGFCRLHFFSKGNGKVFILANCIEKMATESVAELHRIDLWECDGTSEGTVMSNVPSLSNKSFIYGFMTIKDNTFFFSRGIDDIRELWRTDGTILGTFKLKTFISASNHISFNGVLYLTADDGIFGEELWKSDGTIEGTVLLRDMNPNTGDSNPHKLINLNGTMFFTSDDGKNGRELWKYDGRNASMVKEIMIGKGNAEIDNLTVMNNQLFFAASDGKNGRELWRSDGTHAGTYMVKNINDSLKASNPDNLINVNGILYFAAHSDENNFKELWKSDGTDKGTVLVKEIFSNNSLEVDSILNEYNYTEKSRSIPFDLIKLNNDFLFNVIYYRDYNEGKHTELWKSDGTDSGSILLMGRINQNNFQQKDGNINIIGNMDDNSFSISSNDLQTKEWDDNLGHFVGEIEEVEYGFDEIFGASTFSNPVRNFYPGLSEAFPSKMLNYKETIYFVNKSNEIALWKSDGTVTGTSLVKKLKTNSETENIERFHYSITEVKGEIFIFLYTNNSTIDLWKSDGTESGTKIIKSNFYPNCFIESDEYDHQFTSTENYLYFTVQDSNNTYSIWKTDGTNTSNLNIDGLCEPLKLILLNNVLYFVTSQIDDDYELWKFDPVSINTMKLKSYRRIDNLTLIENTLFFTADDGIHGNELWKLE